ncbi:hypothetical protein JCM1840_006040 [Sporobolomyces johnsonii]
MLTGDEEACELLTASPERLRESAENDMPLARLLLDMTPHAAEWWMGENPDWLEAVDPQVFRGRPTLVDPFHDNPIRPSPFREPSHHVSRAVEERASQSASARPSEKRRGEARHGRSSWGLLLNARGQPIGRKPQRGPEQLEKSLSSPSGKVQEALPDLHASPEPPLVLPPAYDATMAALAPDRLPSSWVDDLTSVEGLGLSPEEIHALLSPDAALYKLDVSSAFEVLVVSSRCHEGTSSTVVGREMVEEQTAS